jgi:hypothetical protein
MKADDSPPVVEIIDDDADPFGEPTPSHTVEDTGGRRWVGPVAAAALIAIVGYGIATSASSGAPKVAPAPTTTTLVHPTTTTVPGSPRPTSTVAPTPRIGYYAATPPDDYTIAFADAGEVGRGFFPGIYELWATDGSSSTEGSWFSVQTQPGSPFAVDAYRVQTDSLSIAISHTSTGLAMASFPATEAGSVTITALGISDDDLVRLAQSVRIGRATMSIADESLTNGYQMISSLSPPRVIIGTPVETVTYQSTLDSSRDFTLQVAPRNAPNLGGSDVARQTAIRYALDDPIPFDVNGHPGLAGPITGSPDGTLATWIEGDHIVTLVGSMETQQLIDIALTVHEVSANNWFDMQSHTTGNLGPGNGKRGPFQSVSNGTDSNGQSWLIDAAFVQYPTGYQIAWDWPGSSGFSVPTETNAKINSVVEGTRTYVLADLPRTVAATAQLEIDRAGLDPVTVPFNDVSADLDRTLAAYVFSEPAQFTARIVASDGSVVATWPE